MNSDIRYLRELEEDLSAAAEREGASRRGTGPRSLPRRGPGGPGRRRWPTVAAGIVALLVVSGLVGTFIPRLGRQGSDVTADAGDAPASPGDPGIEGPADLVTPDQGDGDGGAAPGAGYAEATPAPDATREDKSLAVSFAGLEADARRMSAQDDPSALTAAAPELSDLSKIVRTGSIDLVVPNGGFAEGLSEAEAVAGKLGGFVLSSSTSEETSGTLTIRIPADRFDAAMRKLRLIGDVDAEHIQGDDVTAEYMDLQARLRILRGRRALLTKIQSQSSNAYEILRLGNQIDQVQLQIEKIEGQLRYYRDQVSISTVEVELREQDAPDPGDDPDPANRTNLSEAWRDAVDGTLRVVAAVVIGLGYLLPILVLAGLGWFIVRSVRRSRSGD